jgi:uncharacterized membrane protein
LETREGDPFGILYSVQIIGWLILGSLLAVLALIVGTISLLFWIVLAIVGLPFGYRPTLPSEDRDARCGDFITRIR